MAMLEDLKDIAENVGEMHSGYIRAADYNVPYPIAGIPAMLLEDDEGDFLRDIVLTREQVVAENPGVGSNMLERREMEEWVDHHADEPIESIHHTLLYQSNQLKAQLGIPMDENIIFPGSKNHDLPRVNIAFKPDPNWSNENLTEETGKFHKWYWNYQSTVEAYNFTKNPTRLQNARTLLSNPAHPFDPFFLEKRYIALHQENLKARIAALLNRKTDYWILPAFG